MKRMLPILLLLFLAGCAGAKGEEEVETMEETYLLETTVPPTVEPTLPPETTAPTEPELLSALIDPEDSDLVRVIDYIPDALVELKYGTADNFTGQAIYEFEDVFLRYGTVKKLMAVQEELAGQGMGIKIWDGFRPVSAQFKLWEIYPDPTFVANPNVGYSNHSRGFAVDLTIVDEQGNELEMPTAFDDFSARADRDYSECSPTQAQNARLLEKIMENHGFQGYWGEWWHFNDSDKYDVETCLDPAVIARRHTRTETPLQKGDMVILTIPEGSSVTVLGYEAERVLIQFWGYRGYVPLGSLK